MRTNKNKDQLRVRITELEKQASTLDAKKADLQARYAEVLADGGDCTAILEALSKIDFEAAAVPLAIHLLEREICKIEAAENNTRVYDFGKRGEKELRSMYDLGTKAIQTIGQAVELVRQFQVKADVLHTEAVSIGLKRPEIVRPASPLLPCIDLIAKAFDRHFNMTIEDATAKFEADFSPLFRNLPDQVQKSLKDEARSWENHLAEKKVAAEKAARAKEVSDLINESTGPGLRGGEPVHV